MNCDSRTLRRFVLPGFPRNVVSQGNRTTCVAASLKTTLEYYLGFGEELSMQHIYAAAQSMGNTDGGLTLQNAFDAVKKYGVCREVDWPYNPAGNASESQCSAEALTDLPVIKFDDVKFANFRTAPPTGIDEYKNVLCGANGNAPSPVIVGCQMFASAFGNAQWLQRPLPGETVSCMHAMLIYGWCDTPGMASSGYFLAQNSSGGSGNIKIEYEYIQSYAVAAAALAVAKTAAEVKDKEPAGSVEVEKTSEEPAAQVTAETVWNDSKIQEVKRDFFSTQRDNMKGKYAFPGIKLPFPQSCGAYWNVNTQDAFFRHPGNDTPDLFNEYLQKNHIDHLTGEVQFFRIQIRAGYYYRLVSAFMVREDRKDITVGDLEILEKFVEYYQRGDGKHIPRHYFYTVATANRFDDTCVAQSDPTIFLCERGANGVWYCKQPDAKCGWITQEFFRHILPGTYVKHLENAMQNISGHINLQTIKEYWQIPENRDIYNRTLEHSLNIIFADAKRSGKPYARNRKGNILPPGSNLPAGYKPCRLYRKPPMKWYLTVGISTTLMLGLVVLGFLLEQTYQAERRAPWFICTLGALLLLRYLIKLLSGKTLQKYKY